jgi:uncharacterized protein (DUF433 family)
LHRGVLPYFAVTAERRGGRFPSQPRVQWKTMAEPVVVVDVEILSGTPCFRGTRVPFKNLIDYLEGGHSLGEFLQQFPTVTREMAIQALEEAKDSLLAKIA